MNASSNIKLYLLVLVSMAGIIIVGLGGGLWRQQGPWQWQWQHQALNYVCHQLAERSYWINGQPMAICSRCLGIYGGFLSGWMALPLLDYLQNRRLPVKRLVAGAVLLNLVDIVGNLVGFWENTLTSRLVLGGMLGFTAAALFIGTFFNRNFKQERDHHGRITAT